MTTHRIDDLRVRAERTFLGRCIRAFIGLGAIDRAMAIAAQAFTALIPLLLLTSAFAPHGSPNAVADAIIRRFRLTGETAHEVQVLFAPVEKGAIGVLSVVLLVFSGVSLTRRVQRMYQQSWRLEALTGTRAAIDAVAGLAALVLDITILYFARQVVAGLPFRPGLELPLSLVAGLVLWTTVPWLLLDRRIAWRRLLPTGALTAVGTSVYGVATGVYMPRLMESYSRRYGVFGVTLALVSWLLVIAFIIIAATVLATEFDRAEDGWACRLRSALRLETPAGGQPELGREHEEPDRQQEPALPANAGRPSVASREGGAEEA